MSLTFLKTMFGPKSRAMQEIDGSRAAYARMEAQAGAVDVLTDRELGFIAARDSFYVASLSEGGWPYVQHRGGPAGFLRQISGNCIGFADYRGNRQFLSTANLAADERVCLFLMDYPARRRLKMIGHAYTTDDPEKVAALMVPGYRAVGERAFVIDIVGFDWNCPQHITPRFTDAQIAETTQPLREELELLRARIAELEKIIMTEKLTCGVHHVGLTVPDLDQARTFFCDVLGFDLVGGKPDYPSIFVSDGTILLTLWRAADPLTARAFDRRANIGLHHLSLAVANDEALDEAWNKITAHPDVVIDVAPEPMRPGSVTRHFLVFIPGGIRLELATPFTKA